MPGTVVATTQNAPPAANWQTQLEAYLRDAGSNDAQIRRAAELRLAIFPHEQILTHLPQIWKRESERRKRLKIALGIALGTAFVLILPVGGFLLSLKYQEAFQHHRKELDILRLLLMFIGQAGVLAVAARQSFGNNLQTGAIYALIQHQCVELVPLLIETLSAPRHLYSVADSRRPLVMAALTRLLPRFALADREPLTGLQRKILINELRHFNRIFWNPLAAITPEEADFLTAALHFVSTEYRPLPQGKRSQTITDLVEDMSVEQMDAHQEPAARAQVREAARAALLRLSE